MTLPPKVAETLVRFGVPAEVRAGLDDLCRDLGPAVVEALADLCDEEGLAPPDLTPAHLLGIRPRLGAAYLAAHHAAWRDGRPSPGFWRDRSLEGGVTGLAHPLGDLESAGLPFAARVAAAIRRATGPDQPPPRGLLVFSRNAHFGNRPGVFSVDLVPADPAEALAVNGAVGQQHTLPGSLGEASGTASGETATALLWEVQPNIYRPRGDVNRAAAPAFRRHRNWHLATAIAALAWLEENGYRTFVLRGEALRATHEVNPEKPVTDDIARHHDRTVAAAAGALDLSLDEPADDDFPAEAVRALANTALGREMDRLGAARLVREVRATPPARG